MLDQFSKLIAIIPAVAICLSIFYNTGMLLPIDVSLLALFSIEDYIKSAVTWLPLSLIMWSFGAINSLPDLDTSLEELREKEGKPYSSWQTAFKHSSIILLLISVFLVVLPTLLKMRFNNFDERLTLFCLIFGASAFWFALRDVFIQKGLLNKLSSRQIHLFTFSPFIIILSMSAGYGNSRGLFQPRYYNYTITVSKGDTQQEMKNLSLLTNTSNGYIFTDKSNSVFVIPHDQVIFIFRPSI